MRISRQIAVNLAASVLVLALGASTAHAGVNCKEVPGWCPSVTGQSHGSGDDHSTPEPGTLGLLAVGAAAAGLARLRQRTKK